MPRDRADARERHRRGRVDVPATASRWRDGGGAPPSWGGSGAAELGRAGAASGQRTRHPTPHGGALFKLVDDHGPVNSLSGGAQTPAPTRPQDHHAYSQVDDQARAADLLRDQPTRAARPSRPDLHAEPALRIPAPCARRAARRPGRARADALRRVHQRDWIACALRARETRCGRPASNR